MNPDTVRDVPAGTDIPRGCGGEPSQYAAQEQKVKIFPADAGVNPSMVKNGCTSCNIPRGCGGEPPPGLLLIRFF